MRFLVKVVFENPRFNFFTTIYDMTQDEIRDDLIGEIFNFSFKEGGYETCIDVGFDNDFS